MCFSFSAFKTEIWLKMGDRVFRGEGMNRRARRKSKRSLILVLLIVIFIAGASGVKIIQLHEKSEELAVTERQLEAELENAKLEAENLVNREKYMQTKKYVEDEAKKKLGLVYPDEIVIRPGDGR